MGGRQSAIPAAAVVQCGGRTVESYRVEAGQHAAMMRQNFAASQAAFHRGDKAAASELSNSGRSYQIAMRRANEAAAALTLQQNQESAAANTVDLHRLHVDEALRIAADCIDRARDGAGGRRTHIVFIVGRGSHSVDHVARIGPALAAMLSAQRGLTVYTTRVGCIDVDIAADDQSRRSAPTRCVIV